MLQFLQLCVLSSALHSGAIDRVSALGYRGATDRSILLRVVHYRTKLVHKLAEGAVNVGTGEDVRRAHLRLLVALRGAEGCGRLCKGIGKKYDTYELELLDAVARIGDRTMINELDKILLNPKARFPSQFSTGLIAAIEHLEKRHAHRK